MKKETTLRFIHTHQCQKQKSTKYSDKYLSFPLMTFTEFSEFSESRQNPEVVWLPETTDTFLNVVVKKIFLLLFLGCYLFTVVSHNGRLTRGSNGNAHSMVL